MLYPDLEPSDMLPLSRMETQYSPVWTKRSRSDSELRLLALFQEKMQTASLVIRRALGRVQQEAAAGSLPEADAEISVIGKSFSFRKLLAETQEHLYKPGGIGEITISLSVMPVSEALECTYYHIRYAPNVPVDPRPYGQEYVNIASLEVNPDHYVFQARPTDTLSIATALPIAIHAVAAQRLYLILRSQGDILLNQNQAAAMDPSRFIMPPLQYESFLTVIGS